jgi:hypothetical protein
MKVTSKMIARSNRWKEYAVRVLSVSASLKPTSRKLNAELGGSSWFGDTAERH